MSDPFNNDGGDTVGRGDFEEGVDTGVNTGRVAGGDGWGQGTTTDEVGAVGGGAHDLAIDRDEANDILEAAGVERRRFDSIEDMEETLAAEAEENARLEAEDEAAVEEARRLEAEKDAAREEAHDNGEAFYEGETRHDGEDVQEWSLPDGTIILVNDEGEAVSVEWPPGEGPVYVGDVIVGGEPHSVWELPSGTQIVVDADGNTVGTLDEVDVDDIAVDLYLLTNDTDDIGTQVVVEYMPGDDYSTEVVDAESGKVYTTYEAGDDVSSLDVFVATDGEVELHEDYSLYLPPGSDQYIIVDDNGQPVGTVEVPEEPEWSIFGVVEYYDDGEVVVNIGDSSVSVDVVGPDGGISVELDLLVAEGTAGIEWSEDGSWEFNAEVDVDTGVFELEAEAALGQDAAGMWHVDVETYVEMTTGGLNIEGGQHFHFQETDEGFEMNVGWEGKVGTFGFYVERAQDMTLVLDDDGVTATYQDMIGGGHELLGGVQLTYEGQVRVDEDGDVEGATGIHGRLVDNDGDEIVGGGTYLDSELGGPNRRNEQLDTGRDYERQYDDGAPDAPDADGTGNAEAGRFGLAGQEGEEHAAGRVERVGVDERPDGIHDIHMNQGSVRAQEGEEDAAGRVERVGVDERPDGIHDIHMNQGNWRDGSRGTGGDGAPEVPPAVAEALAGRFAEHGSNANHILGQTEGSNWRMSDRDDDALMRPSFGDGAIEPEGFYDKGNHAAGLREGEQPHEYVGETEKNFGDGADQPDGVYLDDIIIGATEGMHERDTDAVYVEEVSFRQDASTDRPDTGELFSTSAAGTEFEGRPEGAQLASDPAPSEDDIDDTPPAERPRIFTRRDGDAETPDDEEPVPTPTPRPRDEWPEIATERLRDADEDGDGVPDRWGPDGPILGDDVDLDDITGAPPIRRTADATADQSSVLIERPSDVGVHTDAGPEHSEGAIDRPDAGDEPGFSRTAGGSPNVEQFNSSAGGDPNVEQFASSASADPNVEQFGSTADGSPIVERFGSSAGGDPNVEQFGSTAGADPNVEQFASSAGGSPNVHSAPATPEIDDDITASVLDGPPIEANQRLDGTVKIVAGDDSERGAGSDDGEDRDRGPAELVDDIAPVAPGYQALPELDANVATDQSPEAESVAQVETAIPAFRPEVDDDVVVAVEIDVTASVVDLVGDDSDELMTTDATTTELDDEVVIDLETAPDQSILTDPELYRGLDDATDDLLGDG